ncbi:MAG: GNAT family N-acetyltransferase [Chloroflexi bacterium]|nr:GNAT family N-acetyltransferase [Chloroflexota bacterium]
MTEGQKEMQRPFLVGQKLLLRPLEESDVSEEYVGWLNDQEVTRYLETGKFPATLETVRKYLERFQGSATDVILAIVDRGTGQHVGNVTLNHINWVHRTADTGLMIGRKDFWGKGYAFEAWSLIIEYALQRLGLRKIVAGVVDGNAASLATLQKLGFQIEGRLRAEHWVDGEFRDALRLGLLRDEFYKSRGGKAARQ